VNYRTNAMQARTLVVKNHPAVMTVIVTGMGVVFTLAGFAMLGLHMTTETGHGGPVLLILGVVFPVVGILVAIMGVRATGARTRLVLEGGALVVTTAGGQTTRIPLDDVAGARVDVHDDDGETYSVRIDRRSGDSVAFDSFRTSSRGHYDRTAAQINAFLRG
jgi:hypothetical protein